MENQVGSINFDANALYLEEESEHEDDKQQDNELRELLSQGGLDGILDDDSMLSSSADSSYDESDSESNKNNQHHPHHHIHKNIPQNYHQDENLKRDMINENEHDLSVYPNQAYNQQQMLPPSIQATPAHQIKHPNGNIPSQNYLLANHFSTPSNNQNPPPPQMLQATIIPTVQEDKLFYRQRKTIDQSNEFQHQQQQQSHEQQHIENDNTVEHLNENDMENMTHHNTDMNQFVNLQKQHHVPHSKLHSLERFSVPQAMMTEINNIDKNGFRNSTEIQKSNSSSKTPFTLGNGVQLEFSHEVNQNHETQLAQLNQINNNNNNNNKFQEQSFIDLNELDEEELKQLHEEEQKQQQEYFSVDQLNRLYLQAQFLYKIRGRKLEEVSNRFAAFQEDMSREIRAMKHKLYLAEKEKESVQVSLDQAHDLCNQYKTETDNAQKTCADVQEKFEKLKQTNRLLEQKIKEHEDEIENLHLQISEQQKLDTLERMKEQHEYFIQQLRDQYDKDAYQMKEQLAQNQKDLNEKNEFIRILKVELDNSNKNNELATIENANIVNRLNKTINDLQAKYNQDILINNINSTKVNEEGKTKLIEQLTDKCRELEQELKTIRQSATSNQSNDSFDFHISNLSNTLNVLNSNESISTSSMKALQNELERALNLIKQKRVEIQTYQSEIDRLKSELTNSTQLNQITNDSNLKNEIIRLNSLMDELQKEKIDLTNDLNEKNTKLDQMLDAEEQHHLIKSNLEEQLFNKQHHIEECEKLIEQLHHELNNNNNQLNLNEQIQLEQQKYQHILNEYEVQMGELKLKLTNREHELQKYREMYIDVCNEKNNLQDALKVQYDEEYEHKLKQKLDLAVLNKLEEQKTVLNEKWNQERSNLINDYRKQIEQNSADLKSTREQLLQAEKRYDQIRLDKANLELKSNRAESELKEKILKLERLIEEGDSKSKIEKDNLNKQLDDLKHELELNKSKLNEQILNQDCELSNYKLKIEGEKKDLLEAIEKLTKEKDELVKKQIDLSDKLVQETQKASDLNKLLSETKVNLKAKDLEIEKRLETQIENHKKEVEILNLQKTKEYEEKFSHENLKFIQLKSKLESEIESLKKLNQDLNENIEKTRQTINHEKNEFMCKKEEEFKKSLQQIEKRFEGDYEKFILTHKESMNRAINEKSQEHAKEKEKLMDMYQRKYDECQEVEQKFLKQIKEMKEKLLNSSINNSKSIKLDVKCQTDSQNDEDYINSLLEKIKNLEEVITNADAHFEMELDRLRKELEEEYHLKLKEVEKACENNENSRFKLDIENDRETIEQTYRLKLEQLEHKFRDHLQKMQKKFDSDLQHCKQDLNEKHNQELNKAHNDIKKLQSLIEKIKKTKSDSDIVIDSLKREMNKMKENHLDELTTLKIDTEREKESLKVKIELLYKQLDDNEQNLKKQLDLLKNQLNTEHGLIMSKMTNKMNDMRKSHAQAIESLNIQYRQCKNVQTTTTCHIKSTDSQTELSYKDVDLLETFRQKYLDTLTRMKTDMMKEFEAQAARLSEKAGREINNERELLTRKIQEIFLPKISELLKEFRVSETMIRIRMDELEKDLAQITQNLDSKKPVSYSSQLIASMSKIEENSVSNSTKRSASSLTNSSRPNNEQNQSSNLYSKSAISMRDIQPFSDLKSADKESNKSNGSIILSSGYKYTPLRQSWSNLSQMHTLSPYTLSNFDSPLSKKLNIEENVKDERIITSPILSKSKYNANRERTENQMNEDKDIVDDDDEDEKDYIYVDDENDLENLNSVNDMKNSYFKKYRTQNIRQKKCQKLQATSNKQTVPQRPHSASNLTRSASNFEAMINKNESKNQSLTRSNTNINSESIITKRSDIMKPKTTLSIYKDKTSRSKQSLFEDDEAPTRLGSDSDSVSETSSKASSKSSNPTHRSASSVINGSTRSGSSLGTKGGNWSTISAFSTNSLPRSRTPNGSSINSELMGSTHTYRSATLSSINKSSNSSNENITLGTNFNFIQNSLSTTSTQYHPVPGSFLKNSAFQPTKKKAVFY